MEQSLCMTEVAFVHIEYLNTDTHIYMNEHLHRIENDSSIIILFVFQRYDPTD